MVGQLQPTDLCHCKDLVPSDIVASAFEELSIQCLWQCIMDDCSDQTPLPPPRPEGGPTQGADVLRPASGEEGGGEQKAMKDNQQEQGQHGGQEDAQKLNLWVPQPHHNIHPGCCGVWLFRKVNLVHMGVGAVGGLAIAVGVTRICRGWWGHCRSVVQMGGVGCNMAVGTWVGGSKMNGAML